VRAARRRRPRRRWPLAVVLVIALVVAGAVAWRTTRDDGGSVARVSPRLAQQTLVNGPPSGDAVARRPLDVHLAATTDPVVVGFRRPPRSGLLFDLDTGQVLWRRAPERVLPIASLTKMMTALVVVAHSDPGNRVRVTRQALAYQGSGVGVLPKGKLVRLESMLNGLLVVSGNDAAIALAQRIGGSVPRFVAMMNEHARTLGLRCTRFSRPDGIEDAGNHSCAADLAAMGRAVLDEPRLARIVDQRQVVLRFPIKGGKLWLSSHNPLIRTGYRGVTGIKTGYTDAAGECIVGTATRHGRRLGVVLLHSPDLGGQAARLLDAGFRAER
jgi:D-alanyl-D-alanine carboxypeptidase (penicillin-binding protein 5/6)